MEKHCCISLTRLDDELNPGFANSKRIKKRVVCVLMSLSVQYLKSKWALSGLITFVATAFAASEHDANVRMPHPS